MLGSLRDADDAVQETWLRLDRSDTAAINDLRTWLSTVAGRVCLDMLRSCKASVEHYTGTWLPEPVIGTDPAEGPEQQAILADSVGMALLVVLEALTPPSGSRSSCTTSSTCRSTRSPRSWTARRRPPGSWPAGPAAASSRRRCPTPTPASSAGSSTPSSPPPGTAT